MALEHIRRNLYNELLALESKYNSFYDEEFQTNIIYSSAWTTKDRFETEANSGQKTIGVYIPSGSKIDSYCIYRDLKNSIEILKLEGSDAGVYEIFKTLESKINDNLKNKITIKSDERRLDQHLKLSALGFKATKILKNHFDDNAAYLFEYEAE